MEQTDTDWEWIIVDDFSDKTFLLKIEAWIYDIHENRIGFIKNETKSNASVCRNKGAERANFENLIFLDADDFISPDFVLSRAIEFNEFAVFKNTAVRDKNGTQEIKPKLDVNYLNSFLKARFIWQTTAILWKKSFFMEIGEFDPNLQRLQDVELTIRALFAGKNYKIIDNEVDFYYCTKPISSKPDIVKKSCFSVNLLITKIKSNYTLDAYKHTLIKSYYFACVKGLHRCKKRGDVVYVKESLRLFYTLKYISTFEHFIGFNLLYLYQYHMISDSLFIKINRHFFKCS